MDMAALRKKAREEMKGYCRVCPVCDGRACAGEVPGMGGAGSGSAFFANLEALKAWRLNMRTIHGVKEADTTVSLFGKTLSMPILAAPMTGVVYNMGGRLAEDVYSEIIIAGCEAAGTMGMCGDGADPAMYAGGIKAIAAHNGHGVPFIKPRAQDAVLSLIRDAEEAKAVAVGMDIDGAGLITMALKGQPVGPKTFVELKELAASTNLPFIVKGVMTPDEAQLAVSAGAAAIVVSNHGGRVLDHTPGAAEVLPAIAAKVKGRAVILADGGVRTGADVLKLLALGADSALVGRPMAVAAFGGGVEGVAAWLGKMQGELVSAMLLTGTASVREVSPDILAARP
ncbi:alpha-hydroxy-acid oxidizing protein [Fundidesulfovibrio terrae]|uniref:alpha-hydroxy-acid oxidizing protein n=1 Tax=Fundidesulfovibrio terrae TaxID=2922866 RepID=UPI001FAF04F6|nr:alpha-hydroxy-acid oxidizing protein [Fundidesulfovibrio terrae]